MTALQTRFVAAFTTPGPAYGNATRAAEEAGYTAVNRAALRASASRLLKDEGVRMAIAAKNPDLGASRLPDARNGDDAPYCCGRHRTTRYCPDCGQKLERSPGQGLLKYVARRVAEVRGQMRTCQRNRGKYPPERAAQMEDALSKWMRWERWLGEAVGRDVAGVKAAEDGPEEEVV